KVSVPPVCGFSPGASVIAGAADGDPVAGCACWPQAVSRRASTTTSAKRVRYKVTTPLTWPAPTRRLGAATLPRTNGEGCGFRGAFPPSRDDLLVHVDELGGDV